MLLKLGVEISRLNREVRRALNTVERQFNLYNWEAVVTSTYEGSHSPGSLHYNNNAFDVRKPEHSETLIVQGIRHDLGKDFDVILEQDHIHVEFDPKKRKPIPRGTV